MARKKKHPEHVNHERWLVSYADFITLLFAFFVVMFAVSQVDTKKLGRFTQSFQQAVGIEILPSSGKGLLAGDPNMQSEPAPPKADGKGGNGLPGELESLRTELNILKAAKKEELAKLQVLVRKNELVLRLADNVLFESGYAVLQEPARKVLRPVVDILKTVKVSVRVEGHTDSVPIHSSRWSSNWELSTARSTAVVFFMLDSGIAPPRMSAAGYGQHQPIASNDTEDGRSKNRRVDLVISVSDPQS